MLNKKLDVDILRLIVVLLQNFIRILRVVALNQGADLTPLGWGVSDVV